jgi:type IV pilus assembly protein PilM
MRTLFARTTPIAVDLGSGSLRAVQLERTSGRVTARHWLRHVARPTEENLSIAADQVVVPPDVRIREDGGFVGREAVLCLGLNEAECYPLRVPENLLSLNREQLLGALRHEIARQLSSSIETVELDYWRLVPTDIDGPNVMVAAAQKAAIQQILNWAQVQKLVCRRIDLAPLASMRACAAMVGTEHADSILGVLDIGRRGSRLCVGVGSVPVYIRRMQRGGDAMTQRIAEELQIGLPVAERYKIRFGISGSQTGYRPFSPGDDAADEHRMGSILQGVLQPIIHGLCEDVKSSFHYAMEYYPGLPVGGLILVGGGANLKGLPERLGQVLGINVRRPAGTALPENMASLAEMQDDVLTEMAGPIGLGLAEMTT